MAPVFSIVCTRCESEIGFGNGASAKTVELDQFKSPKNSSSIAFKSAGIFPETTMVQRSEV